MESELVNFCSDPTYERFMSMEKWKKTVLYGYSQYCIDKNIGNDTPKLIQKYYEKFFNTSSPSNSRDVEIEEDSEEESDMMSSTKKKNDEEIILVNKFEDCKLDSSINYIILITSSEDGVIDVLVVPEDIWKKKKPTTQDKKEKYPERFIKRFRTIYHNKRCFLISGLTFDFISIPISFRKFKIQFIPSWC